MIIIDEVGWVCICGQNADSWMEENQRLIQGCPVEFDSGVYTPDVDTGSFEFPCHRGQFNYQIHLLENGAALVFKEDTIYLCAKVEGGPRVVAYTTTHSNQKILSDVRV